MRKTPVRLLSIVMAGAVATGLFTANSLARTSASPAHASLKTLTLDYLAGFNGKFTRTLDPALISQATAADIAVLVNQGLEYIGTDNKVHLGLAQSVKVSKNRKVYTFTIRPTARYSNGHYVHAVDVADSIKASLDPKTASPVATTYLFMVTGAMDFANGKSQTIPGVKVLGSRVLQISIDKPYAFFLKAFTYTTSWPLDPTIMAGKTRSATGNYLTNNCPANKGAGPFTFVCVGNNFYPAGQTPSITAVPNKYYWGKKPHIQIKLPAIVSIDESYKSYLAGNLDTTLIPTAFIAKWKNNKQFHIAPQTGVGYLTPNTKTAPFNDVNCRLALAYSIDRDTIENKILHGAGRPYYTVVPAGFPAYYDGKKAGPLQNPSYNLTKAKAAFAKCANKSTQVFLKYPTTGSDADNTAAAEASMMQAAGFNASVKALSTNDWGGVVSDLLSKTDTQLVRNGWTQDYPDPQDYVTTLLRCGNAYNIGEWCNTKFDNLVDKADIEGNTKKRVLMYEQAQHIALTQGAWISIAYGLLRELFKPNVSGMIVSFAYSDAMPKNMDWSNVSVK